MVPSIRTKLVHISRSYPNIRFSSKFTKRSVGSFSQFDAAVRSKLFLPSTSIPTSILKPELPIRIVDNADNDAANSDEEENERPTTELSTSQKVQKPYRHFVVAMIRNEMIHEKVGQFQRVLTEKDPSLLDGCLPLASLHLTTFTFRMNCDFFPSDDHSEQIFDTTSPKNLRLIFNKVEQDFAAAIDTIRKTSWSLNKHFRLTVEGLEILGRSRYVLAATVKEDEESEKFLNFLESIQRVLNESSDVEYSLLSHGNYKYCLHATILRLHKKKSVKKYERERFQHLIRDHPSLHFGVESVSSLVLWPAQVLTANIPSTMREVFRWDL